MSTQPEVWLRGPIDGIHALLQPVAHSVLQMREEVTALGSSLPEHILWTKPAGVASAGFHLKHIAGVLDRLSTYAQGNALNDEQRAHLRAESEAVEGETVQSLVRDLHDRVDQFIELLRTFDEPQLTNAREVGRAKLPSTVLGLLFHAAEHSQRHLGQLLVTVRVQL